MSLTPLSPLAKAKANHPTAQVPESAIEYVWTTLLYGTPEVLYKRFHGDPAFFSELLALRTRERRNAALSRYPDDGVATAAVESQGGAA